MKYTSGYATMIIDLNSNKYKKNHRSRVIEEKSKVMALIDDLKDLVLIINKKGEEWKSLTETDFWRGYDAGLKTGFSLSAKWIEDLLKKEEGK